MAYSLEGDPRMILGANGSRLNYVGGQPTMDRGLENMVLIALFTAPGWPGNDLFRDPNEQPGSDFEKEARQTITLDMFSRVQNAAERALSNPVFGEKTIVVSNPQNDWLRVEILIKPPGSDLALLILEKNGLNWESQLIDPASKRI